MRHSPFESKVDRSGGPDACHPWASYRMKSGYGQTWHRGKKVLAHRKAFFLAHGRWPEANACHSCDNPPCCNPAHLFEGSHGDNVADKVSKGRQHRPPVKTTDAQVRDIRANYALCRVTMATLAKRYGISPMQVCRIVNNTRRVQVSHS